MSFSFLNYKTVLPERLMVDPSGGIDAGPGICNEVLRSTRCTDPEESSTSAETPMATSISDVPTVVVEVDSGTVHEYGIV